MYRKILVAYDGSSHSDVALRQASELARLCGAELHMVGIITTKAYMVATEMYGGIDLWSMERDELQTSLDRAARDIAGKGLKATISIREGAPAHEIAAFATELDADLVVIGHSEKGMLARWFEGSVGSGLLRDMPSDLLVVSS